MEGPTKHPRNRTILVKRVCSCNEKIASLRALSDVSSALMADHLNKTEEDQTIRTVLGSEDQFNKALIVVGT